MKSLDMLPTFKKRKLKVLCCLSGGAGVGKSETMTAFAQLLYHSSRYYYEQKGQHSSHDRRVALKYRGMIVGICTAGDNQEAVDANLDFLERQHCDIGFTAARVEGSKDMCKYTKRKVSGVRFVKVPKKDVQSGFARQMVKAGVVEHFALAMKCHGYKTIAKLLGELR